MEGYGAASSNSKQKLKQALTRRLITAACILPSASQHRPPWRPSCPLSCPLGTHLLTRRHHRHRHHHHHILHRTLPRQCRSSRRKESGCLCKGNLAHRFVPSPFLRAPLGLSPP